MIRRVPASAPIHWAIRAANAGVRNPRVLLRGAFLAVLAFMAILMAAGIVFGLVLRALHGGGTVTPAQIDTRTIMLASLPLMFCIMVVPQLLVGGIANLIHRIETEGQARTSDVFAPLRRDRVLSMSALVVIPMANFLLTLLLYTVFGGEHYLENYLATMQKAASGQMVMPPEPTHPFLLMLASMMLSCVSYSLQVLAPIQVMLNGRGAFAAIVDCLRAFMRNLPAMLLACALGFVALFGIVFLMAGAMLVAALLTKLSPIIGSLAALAMMLVFAVIAVLYWVACGYFAWRAMLGDTTTSDRQNGVAM